MRFILGPIVVIAGILVMRNTAAITDMTGQLDWAERYLGSGGTYTWWTICGLGLAILGAMWIFGLLGLIGSGLGSLMGLTQPK